MILSPQQIQQVILKPDQSLIDAGNKYSKKLRMHMNGVDVEGHLEIITDYERPSTFKQRKKHTKSNKDTMSRLTRPMDKVWSAKGGSIYFNLSESQERKAIQLSNNVTNGYSLKKWLEMFWQPHMLDDPFGVILMEMLPVQQAILAKRKGESFIYPTYKSISTIHAYQPKGNRFEYIVLKVDEADKIANGIDSTWTVYRVIDDAFDYLVKKDGEEVKILQSGLSLPNYFGEVPAIRNSDLVNPEDEKKVLSFFDAAVELADQFLLKGSIKGVHEFSHGFAKYIEFGSKCSTCKGTGYQGANECKTCNGSGNKTMSKVSDIKVLDWPESKEDPIILPKDVAAYASPDKTYYEMSTADMAALENLMIQTVWGKQGNMKTQGLGMNKNAETETATEIMSDIKPEADRLQVVSEMAEIRHKFILDFIVRLQVEPNYSGASVNYGRRYMLEGPDVIWEKYSNARIKGAPQSVLDDLLAEYYEAKYMSDPIGLAMSKKLMYVEPFVHLTAQQLKGLSASEADYKAKLYFSEWLAEKTDAQIVSATVKTLKDDLLKYTEGKQLLLTEESQAA